MRRDHRLAKRLDPLDRCGFARFDGGRRAAWLNDVRAGPEELALADHCLAGFLRVVTHPRIMAVPSPTADALAFTDALRGWLCARAVAATPATWATLGDLVANDAAIKANLIPDAYLASLAMSHRCLWPPPTAGSVARSTRLAESVGTA